MMSTSTPSEFGCQHDFKTAGMGNIAIGTDIGGTFTDIVAVNYDTGEIQTHKVLTTHEAPADGVIQGLETLFAKTGIQPGDVARFVHATTLFTNALIEGKGARTGLIATEGFGDIIEIGNERRYDLYDVNIEPARLLVSSELRAEIRGRLNAQGREVEPPQRENVLDATAHLVAAGAESIAVCLLHSYANPAHEQLVAEWIHEAYPEISLSLSSEIAPEIREFDRVCTTAANACIKPLANRYMEDLARRVEELGVSCGVLMMLSNGGLSDIEVAKQKPIDLLESGPAAGAISAAWWGGKNDFTRLLAFDMGGTTAKLSVVENGLPAVSYRFEAARQKRFAEGSGIPLRITTVDLIEIGAGGGSIARTDQMGLLKVGPESAGSEPGPACYGRGGDDVTVTDANLVLGYLNPDYFAGGTIAIDPTLSRAAFSSLAGGLGIQIDEVAQGVHDIVAENMAAAARVHVAERGHDPRDFVMVATGGGGPLHAYSVARKIGVSKILCPPAAGVASALGLLVSPARADRSITVGFRPASDSIDDLEAKYAVLEQEAHASIASLSRTFGTPEVARYADGRYVGQGFTLTVVMPDGPYTAANGEQVQKAFETAYREKFGRTPPAVPIELVSLRVSVAAMPLAEIDPRAKAASAQPMPKGERAVFFEEIKAYVATPVYDRVDLPIGERLQGPLLIEDTGSTLVVGPSGSVEQLTSGNLLISIGSEV